MTRTILLWTRRLWPYVVIVLLYGATGAGISYFASASGAQRALDEAHKRTLVATTAAARADTVFRTDTVERRRTVVEYQTARDTALIDLTDHDAVRRAFTAADVAIARSDSAIEHAGRAIRAHVVLESALRSELRISERLRVPRFRVSSQAGLDVDTSTPLTGLELEVRVAHRWSLVGRIDQRWAPGESTRRQLLVRYAVGR